MPRSSSPRRAGLVPFLAVVVLSLVATLPPALGGGPARLTGRVVDPEGRPVEGALVAAGPARTMELLADPGAWRAARATTGTDGKFLLPVPAGASVIVRVTKGGLAPRELPAEAPGEGALDLGEIVLTPGAGVTFSLLDEEDRPVTGAPFELVVGGATRWDERRITDDDEGVALEDGRVTVRGLAPGRTNLSLEVAGFAPADLGEVDLADGKTLDLGAIRLHRGPSVEGKVLSPAGEPVPGARVTLTIPGVLWKRTRTDEQGHFAFGGLPEGGECRLEVDAGDWAPWSGSARPGDRLEVRLAEAGAIAGRAVLGPGGPPARPLVVRYVPPERATESMPGLPAGAVAAFAGEKERFDEEDGSFRIEGLAAGSWQLVLEHPSALPRTLEGIEVEPGKTTDLGTVVLEPGLEVAGVVVDAETGEPVPGARVAPAADDPFVQLRRRMDALEGGADDRVTDGKGRFTLGGLRPGRVVLEVTADGYAPARVETNLAEGHAPRDLRVELSRGGAIEGIVLSPEGAPLPGAKVMIVRGMVPDLDHATETDQAGHFRIEHLPAGPTTVAVMPPGAGGKPFDASGFQARTVTVQPGRTVRADFPERSGAVVLSGRVLDAEGRPVPAALTFMAPDGPGAGRVVSARADEQGRYRVTLPAAGSWTAAVVVLPPLGDAPGPGTRVLRLTKMASLPLEIPEGTPALERDLVLPAAVVTGTVTGSDGEPVAGATVALLPSSDDPDAPSGGARTTSGEDGSYRLEWVPEGSWKVCAAARGYAFTVSDPFDVGERGEVSVDLVLEPAPPVPVRVTDPGGHPVAGARLVVLGEPAPAAGPLGAPPTDDEGLASLESLPDGSWTVAAVAPGLGIALAEVVAPPPADEPATVSFEETLPVTLLVREEGGEPVPRARLASLRQEDGPDLLPAVATGLAAGGRSSGLLSDDEGRIVLPHLPPGKYVARVVLAGREGERRFTVRGAKPIEVEVSLPAGG